MIHRFTLTKNLKLLLLGLAVVLFFKPLTLQAQCFINSPTNTQGIAPDPPIANCAATVVSLPKLINFDGSDGGLLDGTTPTGIGIGFTMAQWHSNNSRASGDPAITFPNYRGYEPSLLSVNTTTGRLQYNASFAGTMNVGSNQQINTLGVGLQANNKVINVESEFTANTGGGGAQAGIWYGINDNTYVRLIAINTSRIEFRIERNGTSSGANDVFTISPNGAGANAADPNLTALSSSTIRLRLEIDNRASPIVFKGFYKVGTHAEQEISQQYTSTNPSNTTEFFVPLNLVGASNVTFAGICASKRNGSAFTASYDYFKVEEKPGNLIFSLPDQNVTLFQGATQTFSIDIGTDNNTNPIVTLLASEGGNAPAWLKVDNKVLSVANNVLHPTSTPEIIFTVDASSMPIGIATAVVTASAPGFNSASFNVVVDVKDPNSTQPYVVSVNPPNNAIGINPIGFSITANDIYFPAGGVLDGTTVNATNVQLWRLDGQGNEVESIGGNANDTGGGDAITFNPTSLLQANTRYRFKITAGVKLTNGISFIPFVSEFVTGEGVSGGGEDLSTVAFTKVEGSSLGTGTEGRYTSLVIGPDGKLYATTLNGIIKRWTIQANGTLTNLETLSPPLKDVNGNTPTAGRIIIGLAFDPSATASNLIAYITHSTSFDLGAGPLWDGIISKLTGPNLNTVQDLVINLPRSVKDHMTNSLVFGPDGHLYIAQASNNGGGAFDNNWQRDETLLSGAVLKLDLTKLAALGSLPLNARTSSVQSVINAATTSSLTMSDGNYNPYATNAPLTIYASGLRNAYDLVWHSNGKLYAPTNGSAGGSNTPASVNGTRRPFGGTYDHSNPSFPSVPATFGNEVQRDWLFKVDAQGYYGHPNPFRGEYVMNRAKIDVAKYPAGVVPDVNYRGAAFDFGFNKSPNGVIEYRSESFGGILKGKLLVCRFSGGSDIIALTPGGASLNIVESHIGLTGFSGLVNPLDVIEQVGTGNLYVSQYDRGAYPATGQSRIVLLRPNLPPGIALSPNNIVTSRVQNTGAGTPQNITIRNTGTQTLSVTNITLTGTNPTQFVLNLNGNTLPYSLAPNATLVVSVAFNPTTAGVKEAQLVVSSNDPAYPNLQVSLNGLGLQGGGVEPSLQHVFNTYGFPLNTGDTNPNVATIETTLSYNSLLGDELPLQSFEKAGTGQVSVEILGGFGPNTTNPAVAFGWYPRGNTTTTTELFTISDVQMQSLNITPTGSTTFDPGLGNPFGMYARYPIYSSRIVRTEDALNTFSGAIPHHVRAYAYKRPDGSVVPNAYILAFEDNTTGYDYNDLIVVLRNVKPYQAVQLLSFSPDNRQLLLAQNRQGAFNANLNVSTGGTNNVTLNVSYAGGANNWLSVLGRTWGVAAAHNSNAPQLTFQINTNGVAPGNYTATVTASATGFVVGNMTINLIVTDPAIPQTNVQINFQAEALGSAPVGWQPDNGNPFGNRGNGFEYGWSKISGTDPDEDNYTANTVTRGTPNPLTNPTDFILRTHIRPQAPSGVALNLNPGKWELAVRNGYYEVTVQAGDRGTPANSNLQRVNVEGINAINFVAPNPGVASVANTTSGTVNVLITDGRVTLDCQGGTDTRLISAVIKPSIRNFVINPNPLEVSVDLGQTPGNQNVIITPNLGDVADLTLTKSANSPWLILPAIPSVGNNSFAFNITGLTPGTYNATVTVTALGFQTATLPVKLTILAKNLEFTPAVLDFTVQQGGTTTAKNTTLSAIGGVPTQIRFDPTEGGEWLTVPAAQLGDLAFNVNVGGLAPGTYKTTITANAPNFAPSVLTINLTVNAPALSIPPNNWDRRVNFQSSQTGITTNFYNIKATGGAYGSYPTLLPGNPNQNYGWVNPITRQPQSNTTNTVTRNAVDFPGIPTELRTLARMQESGSEADWEMELPNGFYYVKVSVGDALYDTNISAGFTHRIYAEGKKIVDFRQTAGQLNGFRQDSAVVEITDGRLSLSAYNGVNTRINYVWIKRLLPASDNVPPVVNLEFDGVRQAPFVYRNPLQIRINASDAGGAGLSLVEYSINGGAFQTYSSPILFDVNGNYTIQVRARDANNNVSLTPVRSFRVVPFVPANTKMIVRNVSRFLDDENYSFSFIQRRGVQLTMQGPAYAFPNNLNYNKDVDTVRILNRGLSTIILGDLILSDQTNFKISQINGVRVGTGTGEVPITNILPMQIPVGGVANIEIIFTARNYNLSPEERVKIFHETLTIVSNDDTSPTKVLNLHGLYQEQIEGNNEPRVWEIIEASGMRTQTGYDIANTNHRTPIADEIFSSYFVRANPALQVKVRQMAAYHTINTRTAVRYWPKPAANFIGLMHHHLRDAQTLLPRKSNGTVGEAIFPQLANIADNTPFSIKIGRDDTDPFRNEYYVQNPSLSVDPFGNPLRGVRVWRAKDWNGRLIPNAYIMSHDFLARTANFDYNDDVYYVENVKPEVGTSYFSELTTGNGIVGNPDEKQSALKFAETNTDATSSLTLHLRSLGKTFATGGNEPDIYIERIDIVGNNVDEFTASLPTNRLLGPGAATTMQVNFAPKTPGLKQAMLLIWYGVSTPLRVPLFGISKSPCISLTLTHRVKTPRPDNTPVVINGVTWSSDLPFRINSNGRLDNMTDVSSEIALTDDDALYRSYMSSRADFLPMNYRFPVTNGNYWVRLHFCENFFRDEFLRVNNIFLEGQPQILGLDIFQEAGFKTALVKDFNINVTDGFLNLDLNPTQNRPAISGVEIFRVDNTASNFTLTSTSITGSACNGANGAITLQANNVPGGASALYKLTKFGTYQTSPTFNNLAAGTYIFFAKANVVGGCEVQGTFVIPEVGNTIDFSVNTTPVSCGQTSDGTAFVTGLTGGVAPYLIEWSTFPVQQGSGITNLPPGNLTVTVTDAIGCSKSVVINIGFCSGGNNPPVVSNPIPDLSVFRNSEPTILNLNNNFTDFENDPITYTVQTNTNTALVATTITNNFLELTYTANQTGTANITIRATDSFGAFVEDVFQVRVLGVNITVSQINRGIVRGSQDKVILGIQINNPGGFLEASSFQFSTAGNPGTTNVGDIELARLYHTTTPVFADALPVGNAVNAPNGNFSIQGFTQALLPGINYFWLTYDIAPGAAMGNLVDAQLQSVTMNGSNFNPSNGNPVGARVIMRPDVLPGRALQFNGTNQYVQVDNEAAFDFTSEVGIEAWIRVNAFDKPNQTIVSKGNVWALRRAGTSNTLSFSVQGPSSSLGGLPEVIGNRNVNDGEWHHVAAFFTGSSIQLYVDGFLDGDVEVSGAVVENDFPLCIGHNAQEANTQFNGWIDEVKIWGGFRTRTQVRENRHLTMAGNEANLVAYFQLNEASGTQALDIVGAFTGTLFNMNDSNWSASPVPIGPGMSYSTNSIANTTVNFVGTGLSIGFGATHPNGELVVTKLDISPAGNDPSPGHNKTTSYWIVNNYGAQTGLSPMSLRYSLPDGFLLTDNVSGYRLFKRGSNAFGAWESFVPASVDPVNDIIVINGITSFSQTIIGGSDVGLPVRFLSFVGERVAETRVQLRWTTTMEQRNAGYEVEKSLDGRSFTKIGFVPGAINSQTIRHYTFVDEQALEAAYYRLRQVDTDGTFAYSSIVYVGLGELPVRIYPNPITEGLWLHLQVDAGTTSLQAEFSDMQGRQLGQWRGNSQTLENHLNDRLKDLPAGIYFIKLLTSDRVRVVKIIKQ